MSKSYQRQWDDLLRREIMLRFIFNILEISLFFAPLGILLFAGFAWGVLFLSEIVFDSVSTITHIFVVTFLIAVAIGCLMTPRYSFRCPRCKRLFFIRLHGQIPNFGDGSHCLHCGLKRDEQ